MFTQNLFYAKPNNQVNNGFYFTDLETYKAETNHLTSYNSIVKYELQAIHGQQIDLELFAGLNINHQNITQWFMDIQPLTKEEKVGLWFLVDGCGYDLTTALETIQDGIVIFQGSKRDWTGKTDQWLRDCQNPVILKEFKFIGETWCANPL